MEPSPKRHVPVSVNVESLFSTSGQPAQMELLPNIQTAMPSNVERQQLSTNQSFLQVSPRSHGSSFKLALQQPLSINKQSMQRESTSKVQSTLSASKGSKQMSSTNKPGKMEPLTKVQSVTSPTLGSPQLSAKNKRKSQTEKLPKVQSINLGNQMASTNRRTAPAEPSPKVQTESFESVRSKLRESLAAALALVSEQQRKIHATGKKSSTEGTDTQGEMAYGSQQGEVSSIVGSGSSFAVSETPSESMSSKADQHNILRKPDESHFLLSDTFNNESASDYTQMWKCDVQDFGLKHTSLEGDVSFRNNLEFKDELLQENGLSWACDLDVESSESKENGDPKRLKLTLEEANSDVKVSVDKTQLLATQIEAKLFRLFGGVNKKYKEKGRSLLFNLKDPSNPELRERVFSEEISPERLCSMTAEELASKQLTEWRIAKAEELAQMVVLPELDVDLRRLVKKTHKGEFQVEVEQDDNVPVEVALGANALHQVTPRTNEAKNHLKSIDYETQHLTRHNEAEVSDNSVVRKKVDLGAIEYSNNLTTRAHDMQELMVDELKDAEFLPPIVSLDEFMEALDIEPPFDNLPVIPEQDSPTNKKVSDSSDARFVSMPDTSHMMNAVPERLESKSDVSHGVALKSDKGSDRLGTKLDHSRATLAEPLYAAVGHPDKIDSRNISANHDRALESSAVDSELGNSPQGTTSKGENVWEGLVQLNISSLVTVLGFFRSGEKASTKEWPSFLEIKGRVRVDAFEKFLQELPSSRSRAIMVVHFQWKEGSPDSGRMSLSETVDSYVADERVGFAEPAPGVELYFCPPHARTIQMLENHIPKEHTETLASTVDGLIGIVVWRRPHVTSAVSPRLSNHKHSSSRKHSVSRKQQSLNADVTKKTSMPAPVNSSPSNPGPQQEEVVDDVPPGFGPRATRDEDDLPEFDFRGTQRMASNPPQAHPHRRPLSRPAEQMRELIHKYGQGEAGIQSAGHVEPYIQPWDDDDDDIPEWQPLQDSQPQLHGVQHQTQQHQTDPHLIPPPPKPSVPTAHAPHRLVPHAAPLHMPMQPQVGVVHVPRTAPTTWQPGAWWPHAGMPTDAGFAPHGPQRPCHHGGQPAEGQYNGLGGLGNLQNAMDWRSDVPRSKGI